MPFRREFAELALASAREMQLGHAKDIMYVGESKRDLSGGLGGRAGRARRCIGMGA